MKVRTAIALAGLAALGVACKPVVPPPPATQTLTVVADAPYGFSYEDWTLGTGQGAVVGAGFNCHTPSGNWLDDTATTCTREVATGTTVTLVTRPDDATSYADWKYGGDCAGDGAVACTLKMDKPHTVNATFSMNGLDLIVRCQPGDPHPCYGTATATVTDWGGNLIGTYTFGEYATGDVAGHHMVRLAPGTQVTITIAGVDPAYARQNWSGDCETVPVGSPCSLVTPDRGLAGAGYGAVIE